MFFHDPCYNFGGNLGGQRKVVENKEQKVEYLLLFVFI
jgi:hypothetical protein